MMPLKNKTIQRLLATSFIVSGVFTSTAFGDDAQEVIPKLNQIQKALDANAPVQCDAAGNPVPCESSRPEDMAPDPVKLRKQPDGVLFYHNIKTDAKGTIAPWCDTDAPHCYDRMTKLPVQFWKKINLVPAKNAKGETVQLPYYMVHQVWKPEGDSRGIGGDQIQMAMNSWRQLYAYSCDEDLKKNMRFMADYYLQNSLSSKTCTRSKDSPDKDVAPGKCPWGGLPYPYNTDEKSGTYDGDMVQGKGILQPDKAGSFALELTHLYKMTKDDPTPKGGVSSDQYLKSAISIAKTLMSQIKPGDADHSPLPFKVKGDSKDGETVNLLKDRKFDRTAAGEAGYTTNWSSTMQLFLDLQKLDPDHASEYKKSFNVFLDWMKKYPLQNNKWGPFFEDVSAYSDTQINATTNARFIMEHSEYFPDWKKQVPKIFDWTYATLGDKDWEKYHVVLPVEQTSYRVPGESHTARQCATELLYGAKSGDHGRDANAIAQCNWATYMVDNDGKNVFPSDEIWMTDGYGDYVQHYLKAMATNPELAPNDQDHILSTTSVLNKVSCQAPAGKPGLAYHAFDDSGTETIKLAKKPASVLLDGEKLKEKEGESSSSHYSWLPSASGGGVLSVTRDHGDAVTVIDTP